MPPRRIEPEPLAERSQIVEGIARTEHRHGRRAGANRLVKEFDALAGSVNPVNAHRAAKKRLVAPCSRTQQMKELAGARRQCRLRRRQNHMPVTVVDRTPHHGQVRGNGGVRHDARGEERALDNIDAEGFWQEAEKARNLGKVGVDSKRFRSRSMKAFMEDLHSGKAAHLFPVSPAQVKSGKVARKDVPYMQRKGGSWDDSDLNRFGRSMKAWRTSDVDYE